MQERHGKGQNPRYVPFVRRSDEDMCGRSAPKDYPNIVFPRSAKTLTSYNFPKGSEARE